MRIFVLFCLIMVGANASAVPPEKNVIETNALTLHNPPKWLKRTRVEKSIDRIQTKLEWTIRRIQVYYYSSFDDFAKAHSLGPMALAVTQTGTGEAVVQIGPSVTSENFDGVLAHELVHVIAFQKYKTAIPKWLEEGLANHLAKMQKVDYKWLAAQPFPPDVKELAHPMRGSTSEISYRYKASQAFAEMLDKKCDLENLIRLSVERKMEDYMRTYCEIPDLNEAFRAWVKKKAGPA
ncbi:MAG: hypothetical protein AB7F86_12175 [Bdellovibrionales bacterium]